MPSKSKSQTTTRRGRARRPADRLPTDRPPTHPGEMLRAEFLEPLGITQTAFSNHLGVSFPRLNEIIKARRSVTPDTALRLARVLGMSADFWLGLQTDWDLWHAMRSDSVTDIEQLTPLEIEEGR
jgi:addiction module HigA family antidote